MAKVQGYFGPKNSLVLNYASFKHLKEDNTGVIRVKRSRAKRHPKAKK